jgi:hypothetical protein
VDSSSSSSSSEPELEIVETVDLISSSDDEVKKERGASSRRLPKSKNKTDDRVRAAEFFDLISKFPIVALERCPSQLPAHVNNKVVEKAGDDEERIINLPGYPQLLIAIVKSSQQSM